MPENTDFQLFTALATDIEVPSEGTLSRTLIQNDNVKVVLFAFSGGQELSEHTSAFPAMMHLVSGEAAWGLGSQAREAKAGDWVYMPPNLPHRVATAAEPAVMLLILLKSASRS